MEEELKALLYEGKSFVVMWKKNMWLIVTFALVGFILGCLYRLYPTDNIYFSTTQIYSLSSNAKDMIALTDLVKSNKVVDKAVTLIGNENITKTRMKEMLFAEYSTSTMRLSVYASSKSPEEALLVGNTVVKVLINTVNNQMKKNELHLLEESEDVNLSENGVTKQWIFRGMFTVAFGLIGILFLAIRRVLKKEILIAEDFTCDGQLHLLGLIPRYRKTN